MRFMTGSVPERRRPGGWPALRLRVAGDESAGPRQLKVVAADLSIDVEDLADEREILRDARAHRPHVDLAQRHAPRRDLGVVEAAVALDRERAVDDVADRAAALVLAQSRQRHVR